MNNLLELPRIYYINLDRSPERKEYIQKHFSDFGVINYERVSAVDYKENNIYDYIHENFPSDVTLPEIACTISHFNAIKEFLKSGEEWGIISEDDIDLSTSKNWNFSWEDFFNIIKNIKGIFQLTSTTLEERDIPFNLHVRSFWDWGTIVYLINKQYAEKILDYYLVDNKIDLNKYKSKQVYLRDSHPGGFIKTRAVADEIIYSLEKNIVFSIPIFNTTVDTESSINESISKQSESSIRRINTFWNIFSSSTTIFDILDL